MTQDSKLMLTALSVSLVAPAVVAPPRPFKGNAIALVFPGHDLCKRRILCRLRTGAALPLLRLCKEDTGSLALPI